MAIRKICHKSANNLTGKFQYAYRKHHSCETALVRIQNDLLQNLDVKRCSFLVLLDLLAACDTVDHPVLLNRLSSVFRIQDQALAWVESYLHQRKKVCQH